MSQADLLRTALGRQGRTAYQLTRELGLSRSSLYNVLNGQTTFADPDLIARLAAALDLAPDALYTSAGKLAPDMVEWLAGQPYEVKRIRGIMEYERQLRKGN